MLLSVQGMDVAGIAKVTFTSPDRVREVINNFNEDDFDSLFPKHSGGRPPTFTLPQRQQVKKIALSRPVDHGLPFSTWSLAKLADFLVAEGVVDDISHEGLRTRCGLAGGARARSPACREGREPLVVSLKSAIVSRTDRPSGGLCTFSF